MAAQISFLNSIAFTEIFDKRIYLPSIQKEKKNKTTIKNTYPNQQRKI